MKINLLKLIFIIFIFFSPHVYSELTLEDNFPKNMQGIWSDDCSSEYQVFIISKSTTMWIDETYVGFNISQTSNVNNWIGYKWGEIEGSFYYFLKKEGDKLFETVAPEGWDGIDYSFLNNSYLLLI